MNIKLQTKFGAVRLLLDESRRSGGVVECEFRDGSAEADVVESMILAHACSGIDVTHPNYVEGIETALEAIDNQAAEPEFPPRLLIGFVPGTPGGDFSALSVGMTAKQQAAYLDHENPDGNALRHYVSARLADALSSTCRVQVMLFLVDSDLCEPSRVQDLHQGA